MCILLLFENRFLTTTLVHSSGYNGSSPFITDQLLFLLGISISIEMGDHFIEKGARVGGSAEGSHLEFRSAQRRTASSSTTSTRTRLDSFESSASDGPLTLDHLEAPRARR